MKPSDVIREAYKLIRKPENWTQGEWKEEGPCGTRYCSSGALTQVCPDFSSRIHAAGALNDDARAYGHRDYVSANDSSTHDAVLRAFRRVYAKLKREGR
jgi:hypothetical protein